MDVITIQIDKVDIPVVKPENLIKIKKLSNRPRDLLDIQEIQESIAAESKGGMSEGQGVKSRELGADSTELRAN